MGHMPPKKNKEQPTKAERDAMPSPTSTDTLTKIDCTASTRDPGRVTLRRLNRAEYNNTDPRPLRPRLPSRPPTSPRTRSATGSTTSATCSRCSPCMVEKYMAAADEDPRHAAIPTLEAIKSSTGRSFRPQGTCRPSPADGQDQANMPPKIVYTKEGTAGVRQVQLPRRRRLRRARSRRTGNKVGGDPGERAWRSAIDGKDRSRISRVEAPADKPIHLGGEDQGQAAGEVQAWRSPSTNAFRGQEPETKTPLKKFRTLGLDEPGD